MFAPSLSWQIFGLWCKMARTSCLCLHTGGTGLRQLAWAGHDVARSRLTVEPWLIG